MINLETGQCIGSTRIRGTVDNLNICQDDSLEIVSLLITNKSQQQWRLILKQQANGSTFVYNNERNCSALHLGKFQTTGEIGKTIFPPVRSRLQGLKQLSVEKLTILKQKLAETRSRNVTHGSHIRDDSECNNVTYDGMFRIKNSVFPLEPLSTDRFLSPQFSRQGQHLYTAYCTTSNHVTIHEADISVVPSHMYKLPEVCRDILLTENLFFVVGSCRQLLWVISCPLCEVKINDDSQFNSQAIIAKFQFENSKEVIKSIYRITDFNNTTAGKKSKSKSDNKQAQVLPKKVNDLNIQVALIDTCLVVTNYGVYKVIIRNSLVKTFIELALKGTRDDIGKAIRVASVFGMNVLELFEFAGDVHLANGRFTKAAVLYKLSRCKLLKGVLKTAASGHTAKLLECLNHCLTSPAVTELTTTMRIHLSNLTVFAFSQLILQASSREANKLYKHFLLFLSRNIFYDERWVVEVMSQTCLWKILHHLTTQRGLCVQVLDVLIKIVQSYSSNCGSTSTSLPLKSKYGLLICISEPSLLQAMLTIPHLATSHMKFVIANIKIFHLFILERLATLYDPTNPEFRPKLIRYQSRHRTTSYSSQSSQCDSIDSSDVLEENGLLMEEFIETFLLVLLTLISKKKQKLKHNQILVNRVCDLPGIENRFIDLAINVDFKRRLLAVGYGHVVLIRNGNIYTWGNASHGCLGTGPLISKYGPPQAVTTFRNMDIQVLSVSCGRSHTLAVTNNGLYAWGASQYGQLGLGRVLQTPNPKLISCLANEIVVDAVAGQYHSVALTMDGRVFTWGWGVHGQLGHGNTHHENIPIVVTSLLGNNIRSIAAGHAHTLALSVDGEIYAFGCNIFGQLGIGNNIKSSYPVKITLLSEPICEIASGYFHNLAVSWTNKLYIWGSSPQVLRLQTQAQKKSKLQEFQAAVEKYAEILEEFDTANIVNYRPTSVDGNYPDEFTNVNLSLIDKLAIHTINERKSNYFPYVGKSINLRDINLGLLEETQSHLKPVLVDTSLVNGRIVQISTGCHHSALLTKDGTVYCWGRNLDGQIGNGTRRDVNIPTPLTYNSVSVLGNIPPRNINRSNNSEINSQLDNNIIKSNNKKDENHRVIKAVTVCCGCEFTIAIQPGGTVLSWGSNSVAQLGRPPTKDSSSIAEKLVLIKSSKRIVRLPPPPPPPPLHGAHVALDTLSQVPNIPIPFITYQSYDVTPLAGRIRPLRTIEKTYDELTLHYILEQFNGIYNIDKIMNKCNEVGNYQGYSKLALLEQNIPTALVYQLKSLDAFIYNSNSVDFNRCVEKIKENTELFIKQSEKNFVDTLDEYELKKKQKMSISRSLDSIYLTQAQELYTFDCQGGSEELCDDTKINDIPLDLTDNDIDTKIFSSNNSICHQINRQDIITTTNNDNEEMSLTTCRDIIISDALNVISFYINEVDDCAQAILHQILQTIFDYWIKNTFPMESLENYLIKHLDKLFYSLGLILFCQNELTDVVNINENALLVQPLLTTSNLSTKFCLQVCSMIFEYIENDQSALNLVKSFSSLTSKYYGPSLSGYLIDEENEILPQNILKEIMSTLSSKSIDYHRPFIHIKNSDELSQLFDIVEDTVVFTCGHYFPVSIYLSEIIPQMEAELLVPQPLLFPCTAQVLEKLLSRIFKLEILCPQCIPKAMSATV